MEQEERWMRVAVCDSSGLERKILSEDESGEKQARKLQAMLV